MQYRQDIVTRKRSYHHLNNNHTKYLEQLCGRFLRVGKFPPQIYESCGAPVRRTVFEIPVFNFKNAVTLKTGLRVRTGH